MANLQVKNIPESLRQHLRHCAKRRKTTLGEVVVEAVKRELAKNAFHDRMTKRPLANLGVSVASFLEEERHRRNQEIL